MSEPACGAYAEYGMACVLPAGHAGNHTDEPTPEPSPYHPRNRARVQQIDEDADGW